MFMDLINMVTQEKMYDIFFNNQEYVTFVNSEHFKKAVPNEKVFKVMLNNKVYVTFLCKFNKKINKKNALKTLSKFDEKFWLKKQPLALIYFLKNVKSQNLKINDIYYFFTTSQIVNSLISYLTILYKKTKVKQKHLVEIAELINTNILDALNLLLKKHLIK